MQNPKNSKEITYPHVGKLTLTKSLPLNNIIDSPPPELQLLYKQNKTSHAFLNTAQAANFLLSIWDKSLLNIQEEFVVLYLDQKSRLEGWRRLNIGGVSYVSVDTRLLFAIAVKSLSRCIIVAHNHPSGCLKPSLQDEVLTDKLKKTCELLDIKLVDHIILSEEGYYSFFDEQIL